MASVDGFGTAVIAPVTFGAFKISFNQVPTYVFDLSRKKIVGFTDPLLALFVIVPVISECAVNITGSTFNTFIHHGLRVNPKMVKRLFNKAVRIFRFGIHLALHFQLHVALRTVFS
jgi:hypothetical protein